VGLLVQRSRVSLQACALSVTSKVFRLGSGG